MKFKQQILMVSITFADKITFPNNMHSFYNVLNSQKVLTFLFNTFKFTD